MPGRHMANPWEAHGPPPGDEAQAMKTAPLVEKDYKDEVVAEDGQPVQERQS